MMGLLNHSSTNVLDPATLLSRLSYALQETNSTPGFFLPTKYQSCMPTPDQQIPQMLPIVVWESETQCPHLAVVSSARTLTIFPCDSALLLKNRYLGCSAWVIMVISVLHLSTGADECETKWPEAFLLCPGVTSLCSGSDILFAVV